MVSVNATSKIESAQSEVFGGSEVDKAARWRSENQMTNLAESSVEVNSQAASALWKA